MSDKEINLEDYISFTYNRFMMTRVEYLIFTQDEQEAKVLRIIEWCIEMERQRLYREAKAKTPQGQQVTIPEIVWVPISHRFLLDQLQGTVQSETTLKGIVSSLIKKHIIFRAQGGTGPYDPPIFTINKHLLAELAKLLPSSLDALDMRAIMKQERQVKKVREGQKLTPSKIDPLVKRIRETIIAPLDPQILALYSPIIDPLLRSRGGQLLTPKIYKDTEKEKKEDITGSATTSATDAPGADAPTTTTSSLSVEKSNGKIDTAAVIALLQSWCESADEEEQREIGRLLREAGIIAPTAEQSNTTPPQEQGKAQAQDEASDHIATEATQRETTLSETAQTPPQHPEAPKRSRSKKAPGSLDAALQKRVDEVYAYFDKLKQEVMDKPDAHYRRTESDTKAIVEWLEGHPTQEILHEVYITLWNTPADPRTGFSWKKNMWIHSVLKQYETMEMEITDRRRKQKERNVVLLNKTSTFVPPVEDEEDDLVFIGPASAKRRRA